MDFHLYQRTQAPQTLPAFQPNKNLYDPSLYEVSAALEDAINVALNLGQPLLLTGEPGTGKTQLAYHLAWYFGLGNPLVFESKTTSSATDLFYRYDSLAHFQYAQNHPEPLTDEEIEERFIRYAALGEAIRSGERKLVLIDEIDKAPRDLPNDILRAIEEMAFEVPEINRVGQKQIRSEVAMRPIVILTSNSEKNLPDAFLRRVVYYHIPFPDGPTLMRILGRKQLDLSETEIAILVQHFEAIRDNKQFNLKKKPATAELIFWALSLTRMQFPIEQLKGIKPETLNQLEESVRQKLLSSYAVLAKNREDAKALRQEKHK